MNKIIAATFEDGVFKPEQPVDLPVGTKVDIFIVEPVKWPSKEAQLAWEELDRVCEELSVDSGGERMTRDQLHERR